MKLALAIVFSLISLPELIVGQKVYCENLTDITKLNQGYNYIEGDIIIPAENLTEFVMSTDPYAPQNAVARSKRSLWEGGILPYILSVSLNQRARDAISNAMKFYEQRTCIRFKTRTSEVNWINFFPGRGCYSYIGNIRRGAQDISIGSGCEFDGVVEHEIFHALGRWHEQSRPDRDSYIRVNDQNILSGQISNFERVSESVATTQNLDYDFSSIMHYGARAFTSNGQNTITTIDASKQNLIGQRESLSDIDIQHVSILYSCEGQTATWSTWTVWSTCPEACRDYMRNRTRSCVGTECPGSNIERETCGDNDCSVGASWGTWNAWTSCSVTCGGNGYRYRLRSCENGNNCPGLYYEIDYACNSVACVVATWNDWSNWGSCSLTCGGGSRTRTRTCTTPNSCVGPNSQNLICNTVDCPNDEQIINETLRYLGCFQYLDSSNLFYYSNGSSFTLDTLEISAINRAIVKCSSSVLSRNRLFFAMIDGYCMQEGSSSNTEIRAFVEEYLDSETCQNRTGSYQNGLAMSLWYIYDPSGLTARERRDTSFTNTNETNVEEMDREAEACGINVGGPGEFSGAGRLSSTMLYAILALALLVLQY